MKTLEDLSHFYNTGLIKSLSGLEAGRKSLSQKLLLAFFILGAIAVVAAILKLVIVIILMPFTAVGVYIYIHNKYGREFVSQFKERIIREIIAFLDPNLIYESKSYIPSPIFRLSNIFKTSPDRYTGDDYVSGMIGATKVEFSEIHAEYKTESRDSKGHKKTHWHTIFRGIFFIADFNKSFIAKTVVLPDKAEKLFGRFGQTLQSWTGIWGQLVKMDDPDFEKEFVVYSGDQVEARYLLSTSIMKRILDFKNKAKKTIYISFSGQNIYVAIPYGKNLFEPKIFKTLLDFEPVKEYFEELSLVLNVVEDLNLNTRIWTK
jgi:hypothetical protein